jgi:glycosyltransferase involved in cell wall biosynthesis
MTRAQFAAQRFVFRFCDRVVCNSKAAAQSLFNAAVSRHKIAIIPNGLPEKAFTPVAAAIPKENGTVRIGMIARMNDAVKNHPAFLRAAAQLAKKFSKLEFLLVGDGPLRPGLEKLAGELGLGERVIFAGERQDIPAMLASMDVSMLISASESLSNVILESMAAGVPVVATDVGGNPELISHGQTGFLVPPDREDALLEALSQLIVDSDLRARLGRAGQEFARANFHMDTVRRHYEQLYLGILAEKGVRA